MNAGEGLILKGRVGLTSHIADVVRRAGFPARIEPADALNRMIRIRRCPARCRAYVLQYSRAYVASPVTVEHVVHGR